MHGAEAGLDERESARNLPLAEIGYRYRKFFPLQAMWCTADLRTLQSRQIETVGRVEYTKTLSDVKDPITASLFYLALKKKHMVVTLWKQASGHSDQRAMLKFLINDFDEPRWKSAALKNGYALLSQRRFRTFSPRVTQQST